MRKVSLVFEHELTLADTRGRPTSAALRTAPPAYRNVDKSLNCIAVFGVVGIAWHFLWLVAAIFLIRAIIDAAWNYNVWPKLYAAWDECCTCERCDFIGLPIRGEEQPPAVLPSPEATQTVAAEVETEAQPQSPPVIAP